MLITRSIWCVLGLVALGYAGECDRQEAENPLCQIEQQLRVHPVITDEAANQMAHELLVQQVVSKRPQMMAAESTKTGDKNALPKN